MILLPALLLAMASCRSAKTVEGSKPQAATKALDKQEMVGKVAAVSHADTRFVTSKVKLSLGLGGKEMSLSGNLRMKRDDQSLFWNELFKPGTTTLQGQSLADFSAYEAGTDAAVTLERGPLAYRWMADKANGQIKTANVTYKDAARGDTRLTWHYGGFEQMGSHKFPTRNDVTVATPKHTVKLSYTLGGIGHDSGWETRTEVSSRYKQVKLDDILRKLSSL